MRQIRIYCEALTDTQQQLIINDDDAHHHIANVLRLQVGNELSIFNGNGLEIVAKISLIQKKQTNVDIIEKLQRNVESNCKLSLAQCSIKKDKMDWLIQKACELGVYEITPIISELCQSPPKKELQQKRLQHWQKILIGACEQCGRNQLPKLNEFCTLENYLKKNSTENVFILNPYKGGTQNLPPSVTSAHLIIGPEGGFTGREINIAEKNNAKNFQCGPRILRAETAAITALSLFQFKFGDLS